MDNWEITISFKLHMENNEINKTLLPECHYQSLSSVCNNFWLIQCGFWSIDEAEMCY